MNLLAAIYWDVGYLLAGVVFGFWYLNRLPGWPDKADIRMEFLFLMVVALTWPCWLVVALANWWSSE